MTKAKDLDVNVVKEKVIFENDWLKRVQNGNVRFRPKTEEEMLEVITQIEQIVKDDNVKSRMTVN
ncbi:hypothetical protein [Priestia aryabhattai]